jgi:UDP-glucuronate decarboxylase
MTSFLRASNGTPSLLACGAGGGRAKLGDEAFETRSVMKKRVLVTGGAGFLGSHLCAKLLEEECEVLCVDNYYTGARRNIEAMLANPSFEAMRHDVTLPLHVEVDEIYNLACPASPVHYQHDPVQTTKTCVIGSINMLGLAKRLGARILQASTSEVYGDPQVHPQTEDYRGLVSISGPRACYDEGKRCAESLFYDYRRMHQVSIRIARIFNTYGPNMHPQDGRVVSSFIIQALRNEPITIFGAGSQTRSFCYVDDLVDGLARLMNVEGDPDGAVNLGNPVEVTIAELAEMIISLTGSRSKFVCQPLPQDDPMQRCPDISRAKTLLHWAPKVQLVEGLAKTIAYFNHLLSSPNEASKLVWRSAA